MINKKVLYEVEYGGWLLTSKVCNVQVNMHKTDL